MSSDETDSRLHRAVLEKNVEQILHLIDAGVDLNAINDRGSAPLHLAAAGGDIRVVNALVQHGAEVDIADSWGNTPLWTAVFNSRGQGDVILLLRSRGADPNHVNTSGATPVGLARKIANYDVATYFADLA